MNGIETGYLRVKDFARMYKIGTGKVYRLCKDPTFPKVTVGQTIFIDCIGFERWLADKQKLKKLF